MALFIGEFETLLSQLEKMKTDTKIPEIHKAPLLLASLRNSSPLESTIAALRTCDCSHLTWDALTSDLIQEWTTEATGMQ